MKNDWNSSRELDSFAEGFDLSDICDASCTTGYDNDGSTGYELFESGWDLCKKAKGQDVWVIFGRCGVLPGAAYFFIGNDLNEQVLKEKILRCPKLDEEEED